MVDQKLTSMTEETVVDNADLVYVVTDVATTPVSRKMTVGNLLANAGDQVIGTQQIYIDASSLKPTGTNGAAGLTSREFGANNENIVGMEFLDGSDTKCWFRWLVPENLDTAGAIKMQIAWFRENDETTPESKTVEFEISGVALGNFSAIGGTALGTAVAVTDTTDSVAPAEDKHMMTPFSGDLNPVSTPAIANLSDTTRFIYFEIMRDDSAGTMTGSAFISGLVIEYTIDAGVSTG